MPDLVTRSCAANGAKRGRGKPEPVTCWCCGARAPGGSLCDRHGWHKRVIHLCRVPTVEVYCPDCFREYGFPDPPEPTRYETLFPEAANHVRHMSRVGKAGVT